LGQRADGLGEAEPVVAHEEPEGIAAGVTAEAMEDAALGIDGEGRGLLGMEGAEPLPVLAGALEVHELADQLHDVQARADFVEELGAVSCHTMLARARLRLPQHGYACPSMATVAPAP